MGTTNISTKKMVLTAMFACLAYVLCTFVYFPSMAPFQHFVNVLTAVLLGPWYGFLAAFLTGVLRMLSGRTIQAILGAVFGPIIAGLLYKKTKSLALVFLGEVVGTGLVGALASYPVMKVFYGLDAQSALYYIPFYAPSALVGAGMGLAVLLILKRNDVLGRMQAQVNQGGHQ